MTKPLKSEVQWSAETAPETFRIRALYKNHRGLVNERYFMPLVIEFTVCECHGDEPSWVCHAWDYDRHDVRSFSMVHFLSPWRCGAPGAEKYFATPPQGTS